jgi:hypothetical protein
MYNNGMPLRLDITPELESQLCEEAAKYGLDTSEYIVQTLQSQLAQTQSSDAPHLSETETRLLQKINEGLPPETWQHYNTLIEKRQAETLTPDEHTTLIRLSDRIEELNARRMEHLAELARLRRVSLSALMQQLGITAPPHV